MQKNEIAPFLWRMVRTILMADLFFAMVVGVACVVLDLYTLEAYGTLLVWVGAAVLILTSLMGIGGVASRSQDIQAFSLSGAGDMSENLKRIAESGRSSLGCFIQFILISISLIALGYLVQLIAFFI
ncbi:MAG: hypothetical protein QM730_07730 [Anaerolineales bacterium]